MAHLLGGKNCIQSLCKDVSNMEDTIQTITKKVGHFDFASWKFPGKKATELNIEELLEDYSYSNDEESNKLSHIVLFELVIDRFCFLLQSVVHYLNSVFNEVEETNRPLSRTVTSTMSVGLITKMFWNKVSQFQHSYTHLEKELNQANKSLMELESCYADVKLENDLLKKIEKCKTSGKQENSKDVAKHEEGSIEKKYNCVSNYTQTYETAFVPCEACFRMQENLIKVGSEIINICESQGLPSALSKQKRLFKDVEMTASDVSRWVTEQERDLQKINTHFTTLYKEIDPLKKKVTEAQKICLDKEEELQMSLREFSKYKDELVTFKRNYEDEQAAHMSCKENLVESEKRLENLSSEVNDKESCITHLNNSLKINSEELEKYKNNVLALEQKTQEMSGKLEDNAKEIEQLQKVNAIQEEQRMLEEKLKASQEECKKLKGENKVLLKHDQGLQNKQTSLLSRLEALDETCEDLRIEIEDLKTENIELQRLNKVLVKDNETLKEDKKFLENELQVIAVEHNSSENDKHHDEEFDKIIELENQIKLLVSYPVIGPQYHNLEKKYQDLVNNPTYLLRHNDDFIKDMERQIEANGTRMAILENQNKSLRKSLLKLEQTSIHGCPQRHVDVDNGRNTNAPRRPQSDVPIAPKPPDEPRSTSIPKRPRSANKANNSTEFDISSKLADLDRIKDNITSNSVFVWEKEAETVRTESTDEPTSLLPNQAPVVCLDCGKEYISQRDLDVHLNFCYGKL